MNMKKALVLGMIALPSLLSAQSAPSAQPDGERLIGAWHLVSLNEATPNGTASNIVGTLIYTRDGHMSVQLMYPESASGLTNDYVRNGYEASFGSYTLDEASHTVTHHVQGSITRELVGQDLPRRYQLTADGRLLIRSVRADEHWLVVWEHE
jgi:hypothetical protein